MKKKHNLPKIEFKLQKDPPIYRDPNNQNISYDSSSSYSNSISPRTNNQSSKMSKLRNINLKNLKKDPSQVRKEKLIRSVSPEKKRQSFSALTKNILSFQTHIFYFKLINPLEQILSQKNYATNVKTSYISISSHSVDTIFQLKFFAIQNQFPKSKKVRELLQGPYGFDTFKDISLVKLLKKLKNHQKVKKKKKSSKNHLMPKNIKEVIKMKGEKEEETKTLILVKRLKLQGLKVVDCGLGLNRKGEGSMGARKGIFGHLNFFPRLLGRESKKEKNEKINERKSSNSDYENHINRKNSSENSQNSSSEDSELDLPLNKRFELALLSKFIKGHKYNINLNFEEGRLKQMETGDPNDKEALQLFMKGARTHFQHDSASEIIREKLTRIIHTQANPSLYNDILEYFLESFYNRGIYSRYNIEEKDLSLLRLYYICLDIYPAFRALIFRRISNVIKTVDYLSREQDFGKKLVNVLKREKVLEEENKFNVNKFTDDQIIKDDDKVVNIVRERTRFRKITEMEVEEKSKKITRTKFTLEKEILIYLITEVDFSSQYFVKALKIMEFMTDLSSRDFSMRDKKFIKPDEIEPPVTTKRSRRSDIVEMTMEEKIERCQLDYQKYKTIGLVLGDLYSEDFLGICRLDLDKRIFYYNLSKNSNDDTIKIKSVERLSALYNKIFVTTRSHMTSEIQKNNSNTPKNMKREKDTQRRNLRKIYLKILDYSTYIREKKNFYSYDFFFRHFLKCYNFASGAEHLEKKALTKIDNVITNRKFALAKALDFIKPKYILGIPSSFKITFEILKFLKYEECQDVAFKMNELNLCFEYAYCIEKGIKVKPDLHYAVEIYHTLFNNSLLLIDRLKTLKILARIGQILEVRGKFEVAKQVYLEAVGYFSTGLLRFKEVKKIELYHLGMILSLYAKFDLSLDKLAIKAFQLSYKLQPVLDLDFVYHYKTEAKLAQKMSAFSSFSRESSEFDPIEIEEKFDFDQPDEEKVRVQRLTRMLIERVMKRVNYKGDIDLEVITLGIKDLKKSLLKENEKFLKRMKSRRKSRMEVDKPPVSKIEVEKNKISVPFVEYAIQSIMRRVASVKDFRVIQPFDIDTTGYEKFDIPFFDDITIKRCHFKENMQMFRFFELKIESNEDIDDLVNNLHYCRIFNPLFLQYYGICCEKITYTVHKTGPKLSKKGISSSSLKIKQKKYVRVWLFCDDFDFLASSNNSRDSTFDSERCAFWEAKSQSIDNLIKIMYQMTNSLASLHIIGKPYRMLTPHHIALTTTGTFKLIIPFFAKYFKNPDLILKQRGLCSWDDFLYFSPERLKNYFYSSEKKDKTQVEEDEKYRSSGIEEIIPMVVAKGFEPADSWFLSSDVYSLGIFFIQILSCSNIFQPNFFQGEFKVKEILCNKPSRRNYINRKDFLKIVKSILRKIGEQFKFLEYMILAMVGTEITQRPNIFRVREKIEGLLFNETFRLEGLNRFTFYQEMFKSLRLLNSGEFLKKAKKLENDNSELKMNEKTEKILEKVNRAYLLLPNNMIYEGERARDTIAHGKGVIFKNKIEVLGCDFRIGTPYQNLKFRTKSGETLTFKTKDGYPKNGEFLRKVGKRVYNLKMNEFEEKSFLPKSEKILKKISGILKHEKIEEDEEEEKEDHLKKSSTFNIKLKKSPETFLKLKTRKSLVETSNVVAKFSEAQILENLAKIEEYKKYLDFFTKHNDYNMKDIEYLRKETSKLDTEKAAVIDEKLSSKFTTFFDPFGHMIKISKLSREEYIIKHKQGRTEDSRTRLRNCIRFTYSKGVIVNFLHFDKLIKTALFHPDISPSKLFISKINTFAITDTDYLMNINMKQMQETSRSKMSKNKQKKNDHHELDQFWKTDLGISLDQKFENEFQTIAFDDLGGGLRIPQSAISSRRASEINEKSIDEISGSPASHLHLTIPISTYSQFYSYLTFANYSNCTIIDLLGNYFQGEINEGRISKGCLIKNTGHKITLTSGSDEFFYGEIDNNRYIYEGQITHLTKEGYGKLISIGNGRCVYEGEFYNNMPHGKGILVNPENGDIVFKGIFRKGVKVYGTQIKKYNIVKQMEGDDESQRKLKKRDKIFNGVFIPVRRRPNEARFKVYEYNTFEENFIFDGVCRALNKNIEDAPKIHAKMFDSKDVVEGPAQIFYPENGGFYLGRFSKGKKHGKGVYINNQGDKLVGEWKDGYVTGKLFWNIEEKEEVDKLKSKKKKKLKSILKEGKFLKNDENVNIEKNEKSEHLEDDDDFDPEELRFKYYNSYHPNSRYSSKKGKKSKPILRTYSIGNFKYNSRGKLYQEGFGIIGFSDTSIYKGEILFDQFHGYGQLTFSDGSYYKGHFENGLYDGFGALFDGSKKSEIRGYFIQGKPEKCCIYECYPLTREENAKFRNSTQLFKKSKEGSVSYRSNDSSRSVLQMNKFKREHMIEEGEKNYSNIVKKGRIYKGIFVNGIMETAFFDSEGIKYFEEEAPFMINNVKVYSILGTVSYQKMENNFYLHGIIKAFLVNGDIFEGEIFQNRISGVGKILKLKVDEKNLETPLIHVEEEEEATVGAKIDTSMVQKSQMIINTKHEEIYIGEFKNGNPGGLGTKWYPSKKKYTGQFIDGHEEGIGMFQKGYIWKIANFVKGKVNGLFVKCSRKRKVQVGNCRVGVKHGLNMKIVKLEDNEVIVEWFKNGQLKLVERIELTEWFKREY